MHYEINVMKKGYGHYFATNERSVTNETKAKELFEHFTRIFPESEGYTVTVQLIQSYGTYLDWGITCANN